MLKLISSNQLKKDLKLLAKRNLDLSLLDEIVEKLLRQEALPKKNKDHALTGNFIGFRECHIKPDWLLIYRIDEGELILFLSRTGTHSDLY